MSDSGGSTERISQFVDYFMGPLVPLSQSFTRDSTHLINILNELTLEPGMLLCTLDITSLYTYTHLCNEGIKSIKEILAIHRPPNDLPHNSYTTELLEVVLSGKEMGTKLAPSYANLFMTKCEEKYVYTYPLQPILWKRFIDDIFFIWPYE